MGQPKAKASKQARGEVALRTGRDPDEVFQWLFQRWANAEITDRERQELALQLLPYIKPHKKAVEAKVEHTQIERLVICMPSDVDKRQSE